MKKLLLLAALISTTAFANPDVPKEAPVSATAVLSCTGQPLITVLTFADGTVIRITRAEMHGFKNAAEVADYGNKAGHNAIEFSELCDGVAT